MFAIIHIGGKQYKVSEQDELLVELQDQEIGKTMSISKVLMLSDADGSKVQIGTPFVEGATIECEVLDQVKGEKIRIFKMNAKKRYSLTQGHRQNYTKLRIVKISGGAKASKKKETAEVEA